jgi:hypothetical protein
MSDEGMEVITADVVEVDVIGNLDDAMLPVEVERAVATAKEYPRSIEVARKTLYELATLRRGTPKKADKPAVGAHSMFYALKRGGKRIEGPSVRFAECVMASWGNLRVYGRGIEVGATQLVAEGYAWDLQSNTAIGKRVTRRITDSKGNRYNADMIAMTENAAVSIAVRNAILSIVPRPLYEEAYEAALAAAVGDVKDMAQHRAGWTKWWTDQGGTEDQLWEYLDVKGSDDIGAFELRHLHGLRNAIKEGMTTFQREMDILASAEIPEEAAAELDRAIMGDDS